MEAHNYNSIGIINFCLRFFREGRYRHFFVKYIFRFILDICNLLRVCAFGLFCNQKKLVPKGKKNQAIFDMTLYDSYFETICDDVASKTVTFTGCEKSHLMCNVALIHFPSAKSTQVRKIWKGDANLNLLKKFHKQKSPLRRRYLRRPMAVLFHSKTLSSSNGRQPQLRSSNFPLGIFSVPCCPNDNKKERIRLAESRQR